MDIAETMRDRRSDAVKRRDFMRLAVASGLAAAMTELRAEESPKSVPKVCTYTEHFQKLPIPEVCKVFKRIGVDGLDLTVRPGGHIEPKDAKDELPKAAQVARDHGLEIMMLTTGISTPDRHAEEIVATCPRTGEPRRTPRRRGSFRFWRVRSAASRRAYLFLCASLAHVCGGVTL